MVEIVKPEPPTGGTWFFAVCGFCGAQLRFRAHEAEKIESPILGTRFEVECPGCSNTARVWICA